MTTLSMILMALLAVYLIWRLGREQKKQRASCALAERTKGLLHAEMTMNHALRDGLDQRTKEARAARAQQEIAEGRLRLLQQELHVLNMTLTTQARRATEIAQKAGAIKEVADAKTSSPHRRPGVVRFVPRITISGRITRQRP